ncbi:MAG TPA: alpha/beta fold hydrolase [Candidatus Limnocylindria bacterium]|nr:alpha/beta fold hydrolase [Candidatus Limnocylindria bacterium]
MATQPASTSSPIDTVTPLPTAAVASPAPTPAVTPLASAEPAPVLSPSPETGAIEGKFDVGGHEVYLNCRGTGSPTIIYLHGWFEQRGVDPHSNGLGIQRRLQDDYRVCLYDRRNLGRSDTVDEVQDASHVMNDLHNLLAAAELKPPYVLLGASFGGLLSYVYANTYPDEVVGMVLLDAGFPDEVSLEHLFDFEDRQEALADEDASSLERIVHFAVYQEAAQFIGKEPAIPVTYFASLQEPWDVNDYGLAEYDEKILDLQAAYVDRFSPGKLVWVDAPHFMEPAIPDEIAHAVREVIAEARLQE